MVLTDPKKAERLCQEFAAATMASNVNLFERAAYYATKNLISIKNAVD